MRVMKKSFASILKACRNDPKFLDRQAWACNVECIRRSDLYGTGGSRKSVLRHVRDDFPHISL